MKLKWLWNGRALYIIELIYWWTNWLLQIHCAQYRFWIGKEFWNFVDNIQLLCIIERRSTLNRDNVGSMCKFRFTANDMYQQRLKTNSITRTAVPVHGNTSSYFSPLSIVTLYNRLYSFFSVSWCTRICLQFCSVFMFRCFYLALTVLSYLMVVYIWEQIELN